MTDIDDEPNDQPETKGRVSALGQQIIGEIETIGGILTGDPITQAEGEFNLEVGEIRREIEENEGEKADRENPAVADRDERDD
jgi:uncharacterized protein YjbJ (UPF0337 family)